MAKKFSRNIWQYISNVQKLIGIYRNDFKKLKPSLEIKLTYLKRISKTKIQDKQFQELDKFCRSEWKQVIKNTIKILEHRIKSRGTKGSEFSNIILQLKKIQENIELETIELDKYEEIYESDLKEFREQIKEKLEIEQFNNQRFWTNIKIAIISFILGSIISFLISWYIQNIN